MFGQSASALLTAEMAQHPLNPFIPLVDKSHMIAKLNLKPGT